MPLPFPVPIRDYPALTGLRGFAAAWVLFYHAWVAAEPRAMSLPLGFVEIDMTPFFSFGWFGVDIFFVLSAFLLALPFANARAQGAQTPSWREYFKRRVLRILPAYYTQLLLVLLFVGFTENRLGLSVGSLAAHMVLWLNIGPQPVAPLVSVWWTLPIEFGYYLLLPFLAPLLTYRRVTALIVAAIAVSVAYRFGMFEYADGRSIGEKVLLLEQLPGRLDQFVIGSAAAVWVANRPDKGRALSPFVARLLFVGGIAFIATLALQLHWNPSAYWEGHPLLFCFHMLTSFGIAAVVIAACSDTLDDFRVLRSRTMVFLGTVSYSLYLWHQLILMWLARQPWVEWPSPYIMPALLVIGGGLALLVAWLSWKFVEVPFLRLGTSAYARGSSGRATT